MEAQLPRDTCQTLWARSCADGVRGAHPPTKIIVDFAEEVPPSPCDGLCANPEYFTWSGGSYFSGDLGTGAVCLETLQQAVGGNCGNFASGRQLSINGAQKVCSGANWMNAPVERNGGYCVHTTAGDHPWAYFYLW